MLEWYRDDRRERYPYRVSRDPESQKRGSESREPTNTVSFINYINPNAQVRLPRLSAFPLTG
jgi:hypothetical protein